MFYPEIMCARKASDSQLNQIIKPKLYASRFCFRESDALDSLELAKQRLQSIRLTSVSDVGYEFFEMDLLKKETTFNTEHAYGHLFCLIPLEGYTYCDQCNQPIWKSDSRPVCKKCADCHMTCHWSCIDNVKVYCDRDHRQSRISNYNYSNNDDGNILQLQSTTDKAENITNALQSSELILQKPTNNENCFNRTDCSNVNGDQFFIAKLDHSNDCILFDPDNLIHSKLNNKIQETIVDESTLAALVDAANQHPTNGIDDYRSMGPTMASKSELIATCNTMTTSTASPSETHLSRRATDVNGLPKIRPMRKLATRHSFLISQVPNASVYSRLSYDFSSLDKQAIENEGIQVRHIMNTSLDKLQLVDNLSSKSLVENTKPSQFPTSSDSFGLGSVMQTTQAFVQTKSKRLSSKIPISPFSAVPFIPMVMGPRACNLEWPREELDELIAIFNTNEFGLHVRNRNVGNSNLGDCEGQIRIHINLLRPIQMILSSRPASIFDVVSASNPNENDSDDDHDGDHVCLGGDGVCGNLNQDKNNFAADKDRVWVLNSQTDNTPGICANLQPANPPRSAVTAEILPTFSSDLKLPHNVANVRKRRRQQQQQNQLAFPNQNRIGDSQPVVSTFRLPRGSTKLLHVQLLTTVQTVICTLLDRFGIKDNPRKFALYEHTIEGDQEVCVRKLFDDELPLGLYLKWVEQNRKQFNETLNVKRLVLQENETDDIEWHTFSSSELKMFLGLLNREENEYRGRIEMKFDIRRKEIRRLIKLREKEMGMGMVCNESLPLLTDSLSSIDDKTDQPCAVDDDDDDDVSNSRLDQNQIEPETQNNLPIQPLVSVLSLPMLDSLSAPVSPVLMSRHFKLTNKQDSIVNDFDYSNSPDMCPSSPEGSLNLNKSSKLSEAVATLPRLDCNSMYEDCLKRISEIGKFKTLDVDDGSTTNNKAVLFRGGNANATDDGGAHAIHVHESGKSNNSKLLSIFKPFYQLKLRKSEYRLAKLEKSRLKAEKKYCKQQQQQRYLAEFEPPSCPSLLDQVPYQSPPQQQQPSRRWLGFGTLRNNYFPWSSTFMTGSQNSQSQHEDQSHQLETAL